MKRREWRGTDRIISAASVLINNSEACLKWTKETRLQGWKKTWKPWKTILLCFHGSHSLEELKLKEEPHQICRDKRKHGSQDQDESLVCRLPNGTPQPAL